MNRLRWIILSGCLCILSGVISGQSVNIDSLIRITQSGVEDTNTVIAYRALCGSLGTSEPRRGIAFGWKGVELAKKINWDKGAAGCYLNLGFTYNNIGSFDTAIAIYDTAIIYSKKVGEPRRTALVYINLAAVHIYVGNLEKAMQLALQAKPYAEQSGDPDRLARVYMTMGNIYYYQERWLDALPHYRKCLPMFRELGNTSMAGTSLMNLAIVYKNIGRIDSAEILTRESVATFKSIADLEKLIIAYSNLGSILKEQNDLNGAEKEIGNAVDLAKQISDLEQVVFNQHALGEVYFLQKKYDKATSLLLPTLDTAYKYNYMEEASYINETLSQLYAETGDFRKAFAYLKQYNVAKDTLDLRKQNEQLMELQEQYEADRREKDIALLNANNALKDKEIKEKRLVNTLLGLGFIAFVLAGFVVWNRYRLRQQIKEIEMRNKIASDLHDDVGASLSSIKMYSEIIGRELPQTSETANLFLHKISENARESIGNMSDIVWMVKPGNDKLDNLVNRMRDYAQDMCNSAQIALEADLTGFDGNTTLPMELRRDIHLIFKEAVNNAVKYSGASALKIRLVIEQRALHLYVEDNGGGFDVSATKAGNGLTNMRNRSQKYKGTCEVISQPGSGTIVHVIMPLT